MPRMVELFEVSFDHHFFLFSTEIDATAFAGSACKGVSVASACNPLNPQARIDLRTIEPRMRRVFVPQSERACICAFGTRLKAVQAGPAKLNEGSTLSAQP